MPGLESLCEHIALLGRRPESDPAPFIEALGAFASLPHRKTSHFYPLVCESIARRATAALDALLSLGADPNHSPMGRVSPLAQAIRQSHPPLMRALLLAGADPNGLVLPSASSARCLDYALRHGDIPSALLLLHYGADPSAPNSAGNTPLHHAVHGHHLDAIEALLQAGADPLIDHGPGSPLSKAEALGFDQCCALLRSAAQARELARALPGARPAKTLSL